MYAEIRSEFGFSEEDDRASAKLLSSMLEARGTEALHDLSAAAAPETAVLCGGGDSLASDLELVSEKDWIVAADGATSCVIEGGLMPAIIVTDLDGAVEDQVRTNALGAVVFVHAHGDNQDALKKWVPEFPGKVVGTCQCEPVDGVFNFGGFTDGDRAACIIAELGVSNIFLAGFDLESPSRKPERAVEVKARKLRWADKVLTMIAEEGTSIRPIATRR